MQQAPAYGLPALDLPPVDFRRVARRIKDVIGVIQQHDSKERFCRLGVKVLFGEAVFADEHTVEMDGQRYTAKNWVIATGSSPAAAPIPGLAASSY